jgi:hypothetical protein
VIGPSVTRSTRRVRRKLLCVIRDSPRITSRHSRSSLRSERRSIELLDLAAHRFDRSERARRATALRYSIARSMSDCIASSARSTSSARRSIVTPRCASTRSRPSFVVIIAATSAGESETSIGGSCVGIIRRSVAHRDRRRRVNRATVTDPRATTAAMRASQYRGTATRHAAYPVDRRASRRSMRGVASATIASTTTGGGVSSTRKSVTSVGSAGIASASRIASIDATSSGSCALMSSPATTAIVPPSTARNRSTASASAFSRAVILCPRVERGQPVPRVSLPTVSRDRARAGRTR